MIIKLDDVSKFSPTAIMKPSFLYAAAIAVTFLYLPGINCYYPVSTFYIIIRFDA